LNIYKQQHRASTPSSLERTKGQAQHQFFSNSDAYLFHNFKTTSAIIENKYSKSIYTVQATNFVFNE
jgi:hypothetical protein